MLVDISAEECEFLLIDETAIWNDKDKLSHSDYSLKIYLRHIQTVLSVAKCAIRKRFENLRVTLHPFTIMPETWNIFMTE